MNILLTSVGRRAYMVKYFKEIVGETGQVHACNSDDLTVAFHYADRSFVSPLIYSDEYIPSLLDYCKKYRIDILISLFDIDLLVLSKNKDKFEEIGTKVIVSDESVIDICNDKWKTYVFLKTNGFNVPKTFSSINDVKHALAVGEISYPVIIKPRFGCGSISVSKAWDNDDLSYLSKKGNRDVSNSYLKYESADFEEKLIYQECLDGQEYGADIINDLDGNFKSIIIRQKLAMRAGETDIAKLVEEPLIEYELERLGKLTRHISNMDCDIFLVNGSPYILEMNARFGGGYPFSHMGGCNLPLAIVKWCSNEPVDISLISAKTGMVGFKELYITKS